MEVGLMFKKLSRGAKFDTKRFLADAQKLQMIRNPLPPVAEFKAIKTEPGATPLNKSDAKTIRKQNHIHIWGSDLPDPVEAFTEIPGISATLLENIRNSDYYVPTAVQMQSIPIMLSGRELLASAPTGSGKTAAFLIPLIMLLDKPSKQGFRALILSPTKELAKQIHRECTCLAENTGIISHILGKKKLGKGDVLISTPNRLVFLLKTEAITLHTITHLIVDECDHLFSTQFLDQLGSVYSACDGPNVKRSFFSATCAFEVEEFCRTHLDNHVLLTIGARNAAGADTVEQSLIFTGSEAGKLVAIRDLIRKGIEPPVLLFVQSQDRAGQLFNELVFEGIKCEMIHSGKSETQREQIVQSFREGKIWVLICTQLLGRGLDFPAVKLVINYDMPGTPIQYIHSIGRTGRAGRAGKAITFYTEDDRDNLRRMGQVLANSGFPVPEFMLKLKRKRRDKEKEQINVPKRGRISKMAKYDVEKRFKMKEMIKHSKEGNKVSDVKELTKTKHKKIGSNELGKQKETVKHSKVKFDKKVRPGNEGVGAGAARKGKEVIQRSKQKSERQNGKKPRKTE